MVTLPPFPVDDQTLYLLMNAIDGIDAERSSVSDVCMMYSELAGSDLNAVTAVVNNIYTMRDPQYHVNDIIRSLATEVRRMRSRRRRPDICTADDHRNCGDTCCQRCRAVNIVWYVDSAVWNAVMPDGGVLCVRCFVLAAESAGIGVRAAWRLVPDLDGS